MSRTKSGETRNAALAGEIRAELARQQLSGRELARRVGKPETTVARYLRGGTAMSLDDIELFAQALEMSTVDLVARAYERTPPHPGGNERPRQGSNLRPTAYKFATSGATVHLDSRRRRPTAPVELEPAAA